MDPTIAAGDGFQIFYIGINVGVIVAPLVSGTLGQPSAGTTASAAPAL